MLVFYIRMAKNRSRSAKTLYRLVISYLREDTFGKFQVLGKNVRREPDVCPKLDVLKGHVLEQLCIHQKHRGLINYTVAWQTHPSNGLAHLDILLKYDHAIKKGPRSFDYLLRVCPQELSLLPDKKPRINVKGYPLSGLNVAIMHYGTKEDPRPLNTFTPEQSRHYLVLADLKKDPYAYLQRELEKDPYGFDLAGYCLKYKLASAIPGWSGIKNKLNDMRAAMIAEIQLSKPGIKHITRGLIQDRLTPEELTVFDTHPAFQIIVDHLNQIPTYGPHRPFKTSNLFLSGPPDIGKTSLFTELAKRSGYYQLKIENKYINRYTNGKYGFILWNQVKLTDFTHTWMLQFLQGSHVSIPMRYNSCIKRDNPLVTMTSNLSLNIHIKNRFKDNAFFQNQAVQNLGARITAVEVPVPMFFMQKLLVSAEASEKVDQ